MAHGIPDEKFEIMLKFANDPMIRNFIVDVRAHIEELQFLSAMNLGLSAEEIDEICKANIPEETPDYVYQQDFPYKFGYLVWRLYHYRNWEPTNP